jgi:hypothetical protein
MMQVSLFQIITELILAGHPIGWEVADAEYAIKGYETEPVTAYESAMLGLVPVATCVVVSPPAQEIGPLPKAPSVHRRPLPFPTNAVW